MAKAKAKTNIPLIIVIVVIVIVIVLAIVLGSKKGVEEETTIPEGERVSEEELAKISNEIYGFAAVVREVKGKTLVLDAWIASADIEEGPVKILIAGVVTDDTEIVKLEFPEIAEGSDEPVFPEETEMNFDELKPGDRIDIATIDNISENIKNQTEFNIDDIFIVE